MVKWGFSKWDKRTQDAFKARSEDEFMQALGIFDNEEELGYDKNIGREETRKDTEVNEKTGGRTL